jgi:hypothetical protein
LGISLKTAFFLLALLPPLAGGARAAEPLILTRAETSEIDGRDWDRARPGGQTLDAVHRAVLLRFPGAAEAIRRRLEAGEIIDRVELTLHYRGHETRPAGYTIRDGMSVGRWKAEAPRWHVVAQALRAPWIAHGTYGPTARYRVRLLQPWRQAGALDPEVDRQRETFGPAELSSAEPLARLDLTALLAGPQADIGQRLRAFESNGLRLSKLETYDMRYRQPGEVYEWAIATGGHGLTFGDPALTVTFRPEKNPPLVLTVPPEPDLLGEAERLGPQAMRREPDIRPIAELKAMAKRLSLVPPDWMSPKQAEHLSDLFRAGGDTHASWLFDLQFEDPGKYRAYLRETLATLPRYWKGWGIIDDLIAVYQLGDFLPPHVRAHLDRYWASYLMPDIPGSALFIPHSAEAGDYWRRTGDWRGRTSFFRAGYTLSGSTQNFNFTAVTGALLGGALIGADAAMAEGRQGLDSLLLRYWTARDGGVQELLDPYYLSITLSAVKMLADYAPTPFDRLAARIILERTMELLATVYHPRTRRLIAAAGRARLSGFMTEQDGIYGALHVLSEEGTLLYRRSPGSARVDGLPVWGYDFPPGRVALQSLSGPWAPAWFRTIIDNKPVPFEETSTDTIRGHFNPPLRRTSYLARHFGLASQDIKGGMADLLATWARRDAPAEGAEHLGVLYPRTCLNICDLVSSPGGVATRAGSLVTLQKQNRALVFARPPNKAEALEKQQLAGETIETAGSLLALWMPGKTRSWRLFLDGVEKTPADLPLLIRAGQVITFEDGPSYLGLRVIPATPFGDPAQAVVRLAAGGFGGKPEASSTPLEPTLTLANMHQLNGVPISRAEYDARRLGQTAYSGFAIEMGDRDSFPDIAAFNRHMLASTLEAAREGEMVRVRYASGGHLLEGQFSTEVQEIAVHFPIQPGQQGRALAKRLFDGQPMTFPSGIERDTGWSQQGTTGLLEKNGIRLVTEAGRKSYLIATPDRQGVLAFNLLPDPSPFSLRWPDGREIRAEGRAGLLRIEANEAQKTITIDHQPAPGQRPETLARSFTVTGFDPAWKVLDGMGHPLRP